MPDRPWIQWAFGRDFHRRAGWVFNLVMVPAPIEEQTEGSLCLAMVNIEVWWTLSPSPRVQYHSYSGERKQLGNA